MTIRIDTQAGQDSVYLPSKTAQELRRTRPAKAYVSPAVLSHSGEDILEELGPAQACYPFSSCGVTP